MKLAQNTDNENTNTSRNTVTVTTSTSDTKKADSTNTASDNTTQEESVASVEEQANENTTNTQHNDQGASNRGTNEQVANSVPTATIEVPNVSAMAKGIDIQNPTWDVFLIGFFVIGALLYGMSLGKDKIISMMLSVYMALAVSAALPEFILNVQFDPNSTVEVTTFVSLFVLLFFLVSRWAVVKAVGANERGSLAQMMIFGTLQVGLLVAVTLSLLPPNILARFSETTLFIFTNPWMYFGWIVAPIIAMIVLGRREEDSAS